MITCFLQGGLGNQLFILFTTIAYALQNKQPVLFYYSEKLTNGCTLRYTYWHTFFKALQELTTIVPIMNGLKVIKEQTEGKYNELEVVKSSAVLVGYFQCFNYFQDEYHEISRLIGIPSMREKYCNWFDKNELDKSNTISMHFRIGDYKTLGLGVLSLEYYTKALTYISERYTVKTVLYFCEHENIVEVNANIAQLQQVFPHYIFKYCNLNSSSMNSSSINSSSINNPNSIIGIPEDEMIIMSNCKYNIIANSTFSWWAAYIGDREDGNTHIVCYPDVDNKYLYPDKWIRIFDDKNIRR